MFDEIKEPDNISVDNPGIDNGDGPRLGGGTGK
jgi:hypothetical protein